MLVGSEYDVRLIEVNTNPCLEEPCDLLKQLVPRMLDDCFKIELDPLFGTVGGDEVYAVDGYADRANMWR